MEKKDSKRNEFSNLGFSQLILIIGVIFGLTLLIVGKSEPDTNKIYKTEKVFFEENEKNVEFSIDGKHIEISKNSISSIEYKIQKDKDKKYRDDEDDMELVIEIILNNGIKYRIESKYYGEGEGFLDLLDDLI